LGGGGAKAAAEIGALAYLDEKNCHIDYIAGTSMGAVVGGLYAAGYSGKEIEDLWLNRGWLTLFDQEAIGTGHGRSFSDKYGDAERTIFGLVDGDEFEERLRLALEKKGVTTFEDLKEKGVEYRCTATKIINDVSIEKKVLSKGDLAKAIRASMSYPAPLVGFKPVEIDGDKLVDGGMLDNLPVDVVKDMGADITIAFDLEMRQKRKPNPLVVEGIGILIDHTLVSDVIKFTKTEWLTDWILSKPDVTSHNINWEEADVKIRPNLVNYNILSFKKESVRQMIGIGRQAMIDHYYLIIDLLKKSNQAKSSG
ncbi:MAG: patatin-like phospholipase family protein, partial [Prevotella sp.]|nr:patatin-like phospholipase family protein [Prevotella sp.]